LSAAGFGWFSSQKSAFSRSRRKGTTLANPVFSETLAEDQSQTRSNFLGD